MFQKLLANAFGEYCNMTAKKFSAYIFTASVVFAAMLHLLLWFYQLPYALLLYEKYNPIPIIDIAYGIASGVFSHIDPVPVTMETYFGEVILIIIFGLQCVLIGLFVFKVCGLIKSKYFIKIKDNRKLW